jgi:hypothetical protein
MMTCEFCNEEGARPRKLPPMAVSLAMANEIQLCPDCWADLQEVTTPRRMEE